MLLAITVNEAAHGYVARYYGDHTAEIMGRLTLNPLKHIDWIGTVLLPAVMFMCMSFVFGWAKPVPVNPRNFTKRRMGERMVSVAGPLSNLLMCFVWALAMVISRWVPESFQYPLGVMGRCGVMFNINLFVLNMIPILPLDGGRFVETFLPARAAMQFRKTEPYGMWVLIFLMLSHVLDVIMLPCVQAVLVVVNGFIRLFG